MNSLCWGAGFILAGGACAVLLRRRTLAADWLYGTLLVTGCLLGAVPAIRILGGAPGSAASFSGSLPGGPWAFALDPLSSWFLLAILPVGAAAGVFGTTYLARERAHRNIAAAHGLFSVLLVALIGVVTSQSMVAFLAAWEVMALGAYLLVVFENEQTEVRRAGLIYIVLTHLSTLALIGMFAAMRVHSEGTPSPTTRLGTRPPARSVPSHSCWRFWGSGSRRASCRCTSGCRALMQPHPPTSLLCCPA